MRMHLAELWKFILQISFVYNELGLRNETLFPLLYICVCMRARASVSAATHRIRIIRWVLYMGNCTFAFCCLLFCNYAHRNRRGLRIRAVRFSSFSSIWRRNKRERARSVNCFPLHMNWLQIYNTLLSTVEYVWWLGDRSDKNVKSIKLYFISCVEWYFCCMDNYDAESYTQHELCLLRRWHFRQSQIASNGEGFNQMWTALLHKT